MRISHISRRFVSISGSAEDRTCTQIGAECRRIVPCAFALLTPLIDELSRRLVQKKQAYAILAADVARSLQCLHDAQLIHLIEQEKHAVCCGNWARGGSSYHRGVEIISGRQTFRIKTNPGSPHDQTRRTSMQTWLDSYTNGAKKSFLDWRPEIDGARIPATDFDAMRLMTAHTASLGSSHPIMQFDRFRDHAVFCKLIAPYFRRAGDNGCTGSALQLSEELVGDLAGARVPESNCWLEQLNGGAWYIDLPHNSLLIGDHLQARAIFSLPDIDGSSVVMSTILTRPGSNKITAHLNWRWGQNSVRGFTLISLGTPPIASRARVWAPIQSASPCVQVASA
jgi:hypothetical protein